MRLLSLCLALTLATPAVAELRPDGTTALLGLGITQNGAAVELVDEDGAYRATLNAAPFELVFPGQAPDVVGVTFGPVGLFDLVELPPETGLFGPGTGYAREEGLDAAFFMTDPLCASAYYGPGFNYLDAERRAGDAYPIAALQVDSASRRCDYPDRLPSDTDLIGRITPLHAVIRVDDVMERLILSFIGS